jgi:uncharacterized protein (TIGR02421 family)
MSSRSQLQTDPNSQELHFGPKGELRETFAKGGRIHIDRWLPFLVLHRSKEKRSIGRQIALNSPAYFVWSPEDDVEAESALELILSGLRQNLSRVLLVELIDTPAERRSKDSTELPPLDITIAGSHHAAAMAAAEALANAVANVKVDTRRAKAARALKLPPTKFDDAEQVVLTVPQIHRAPGGRIYPQLMHALVAQLIDCILRAVTVFIGETSHGAPPHFRTLGRSAFIAAALNADKKLDLLARSFDFLLSLSPINTAEARERFFEGGELQKPEFLYRPLTVDPDAVKRSLYAIDLSIVEDLLLERLLSEKRREIDRQLTMLATRNTASFMPASMLLYGAVSDDLLKEAKTILERVRPKASAVKAYDALQVAAAAGELVAHYRSNDDRFGARVEVRDDVSGLLVSGDRLMISKDSAIAENRLDPLLCHEVSVHLLTYFNGATQGLTIFRTGLAGYEGVQEGLGVFAEWAVGGLTAGRLRLLAGRVIAVDAMIQGASFIDVYRLLLDHDFNRTSAFDISARVFRSGGLAKDAIYLKGFIEVIERVRSGAPLDPFWLGKIAADHVEAIDELLQRGLLHPPVFVPEFLARDGSKERIAALSAGASIETLLDPE